MPLCICIVHATFAETRCECDADDADVDDRSMSVRDVVNWFEPAQLHCRAGSVLRVAGIRPLDSRRSPVSERQQVANCIALQILDSQLKSSCEGRPSCVINFGTVKSIRESCRHVKFVSIDVYCEPPGMQQQQQQQLIVLSISHPFVRLNAQSSDIVF